MLLWIQFWMPILAVINLFIQMSAAGKMAALTTATYNLPSMMGIYQLDMELQQSLSITAWRIEDIDMLIQRLGGKCFENAT